MMVVIKGKYNVTISKHIVNLNKVFGHTDPSKWAFECHKCGKKAMYKTKVVKLGSEAAEVHYACTECGTKETDFVD